jgi:hypothetical protein
LRIRGLAAAIFRMFRCPESDLRRIEDAHARGSALDMLRILESRVVVNPRSYALHEQISILALQIGDVPRALHHALIAVEVASGLRPVDDRAFVLSGAYANVAAVHAAMDDRKAERRAIEAGLFIRPESGSLNYQLAIHHVVGGDLDGALLALQIACQDPRSYPRDWFYQYALRDQQLAPLRRDPRFRQIQFERPAA